MPPERTPPQPPKETRMGSEVPMEAITQMLQSLPIPITIERRTLEKPRRGRTHYYTWQVGTPTPDNPIGISMGATPDFLEAVKFSLEAVMRQGEHER